MNADKNIWISLLGDPEFQEMFSGRGIIGDYIKLREQNDAIREKAVEVLFAAARTLADEASKQGLTVVVEEFDQCRFESRSARVSGPGIRIRHGVRCLTLEAGWTRVASDGVLSEGALALARISHFGIPEKTALLHLLLFEERPRWFTIGRDGIRRSFEAEDLVGHFQLVTANA